MLSFAYLEMDAGESQEPLKAHLSVWVT